MKAEEQKKAIALRKQGKSLKEIERQLGVSRGSVSRWVRNVSLTSAQIKSLEKNQHTQAVIEKRRESRLKNEEEKRNIVIDAAQNKIPRIQKQELFYIGVALYWGEGTKTKRGVLEFANSDPRLIKIMKRFFIEICNVPDEKFRGRVYLHPHLDVQRAEKYWSDVSEVPRTQFQSTALQQSRASKNKKDSLPYGTFTLNVYDITLSLSMRGWMQGIDRVLNEEKA